MSRSPDFILKALNKVTEHRSGKIGALWCNENGSMTLVLDVALLPDPNTLYTLFPNDKDEAKAHFTALGLERRVAASIAMPQVETPAEPAKKRGRPKKTPTTMAELPTSVVHRIGPMPEMPR
jgi:hypothetical protein